MAAMSDTHAERRGDDRNGRWALFVGIAALVVTADQVSKAWVDPNFREAWTRTPVAGYADPTPVLGDYVRIAKSYNEGGLFGLFGNAAPVLAVASLLVIGLILLYQARQGVGSRLLTLALGLLLGGAIGNFIDRVRVGHVIDFVDMGVGTLRWYTFNVADAAISTSIVVLLAIGLFGDRWAGRRSVGPTNGGEREGERGPVPPAASPDAASGSASR